MKSLKIQMEFGGLMESCEFCGVKTRYWTMGAKHTVCPSCAEQHHIGELK